MPETLADVLGVGSRGVIALVGAGGKTTALFRLGRELRPRGGTVVTTTTRIMAPDPVADLALVVEPTWEALTRRTQEALMAGLLPVLARELPPDRKLVGLPPEWVDALATQPWVRYVVVEADGAARRPFTAPRAHEPVVPRSTTLAVAVVGVDALGQPLSAHSAHCPDRVTALSGLTHGRPITAGTVAAVLLHPEGSLRDVPAGAKTVVLLNKADTPARLDAARRAAETLRAAGLRDVLVTALQREEPLVTPAP